MQITRRPVAPVRPAARPQARAAAQPAAATPKDVRVITFNTAVGNPAITTDQADFPKLPFYQKVVNGAPDAPILCLQEVGNAQRDEVMRLAQNGNFKAIYQRVGLRGRQGNMILIPKRYEVEEAKNHYYTGSHLVGLAKSLWGWVKSGFKHTPKLGDFSQLIEPRGYQQLKLKDTATGQHLTVFNSHVSFFRDLEVEHVKKLMDEARDAAKDGPVIVAGDLNTRTADTDPNPDSYYAKARAQMKGFTDMGPTGKPPEKSNIDWVLAKGFDSVASKWYTGDSLSLPGSPDALHVSDHYAEEDVLRYRPS